MSSESPEQLDLEIKRLERDKRLEEIRQLRSSGRRQWLAPAVLIGLLPLLASASFVIWSELKQLTAGGAAVARLEAVNEELQRLQQQKDSLNIEVSTLLDLRRFHADQAKQFETRFNETQAQLDRSYLRAQFYSAEARYALGHLAGLPSGPGPEELKALAAAVRGSLPPPLADGLGQVLDRYELAMTLIDATQDSMDAFAATLDLLPVSDWAADLSAMPSGSVIPGRNIMVTQTGTGSRYYDVDQGRMLTAEEIGQLP